MKLHWFLFTASLLLSLNACKTQKETTEAVIESPDEPVMITMMKGSCFGRCPVYTISLNQDGYSVFHGKRFCDKKGWFEKTFDKEETKKVLDAFANANLQQYQDFYESEIPDLPTVSITYQVGEGEKKEVKGKAERPEAIFKLQAMLEALAETDDWTIKEDVEEEEEEKPKAEVIYSEIIIEPHESMVLPPWFKKQKEKYGIRLLKKVAPNLNYWLITYDKDKMQPEAMLQVLLDDPKIKHAEFNKKASLRNQQDR